MKIEFASVKIYPIPVFYMKHITILAEVN